MSNGMQERMPAGVPTEVVSPELVVARTRMLQTHEGVYGHMFKRRFRSWLADKLQGEGIRSSNLRTLGLKYTHYSLTNDNPILTAQGILDTASRLCDSDYLLLLKEFCSTAIARLYFEYLYQQKTANDLGVMFAALLAQDAALVFDIDFQTPMTVTEPIIS